MNIVWLHEIIIIIFKDICRVQCCKCSNSSTVCWTETLSVFLNVLLAMSGTHSSASTLFQTRYNSTVLSSIHAPVIIIMSTCYHQHNSWVLSASQVWIGHEFGSNVSVASFFSVSAITYEPLHLVWWNFAWTCIFDIRKNPIEFQGHRSKIKVTFSLVDQSLPDCFYWTWENRSW